LFRKKLFWINTCIKPITNCPDNINTYDMSLIHIIKRFHGTSGLMHNNNQSAITSHLIQEAKRQQLELKIQTLTHELQMLKKQVIELQMQHRLAVSKALMVINKAPGCKHVN
jgi:hypothetical protein